MRIKERLIDIDELLKRHPETFERAHARAVRAIADQLFAYPTPEFPHFRTFVNEPEVTQRVFTNYGRELAPDIVVVEWPERTLKIVAEVLAPELLTPELLTPENAGEIWLLESRLEGVAFYLYAPAGYLDETRQLLKDAGIRRKDVGLRTWRHQVGLNRVDVAILK